MSVQNQSAAFDVSTATTTAVVAAVAGKKIAVYSYAFVHGAATGNSVQFKSGSANLSGVMPLPLAVGGGLTHNSGASTVSLFTTDSSAALNITTSAATRSAGTFPTSTFRNELKCHRSTHT